MKILTLVDLSHRLRVLYHARASDSGPNDAGARFIAELSEWRRNAEHLIVACDAPPYMRTQAFPDYKKGRERDEAYIQICRWVRERLVADGYSIASSQGHEADDCVATLSVALADKFDEVRIISEDKDMLACITDKVRMCAPTSRGDFEMRDSDWLFKKWGITPEQVPMFLAIKGDKSDAIAGISGIGDVGATKLITSFGTIPKMRLAAVAAFEESQKEGAKPLSAFWRRFLDGAPNLELWLSLTTLRTDVPLDLHALLKKQAIKPLVKDDVEDWDEIAEREAIQAESNVTETPKVEAKTEAPKPIPPTVAAATAASTASSATQAETSSGSLQQNYVSDIQSGPVSIVVDRPAPPSWALALQPATANEALHIAKVLFNSRHYSQYGSERGVYSVIMLGRELGVGLAAALQGFHIVNDKPFPSAHLLRSLAERDPNCEWIMCTHADDKSATWVTKHRKIPEPMSYTYTRERAEQAGMFTGKNAHNWKTKTQEMLEKTSGAKGVRRWYPGATMGLHIPEEIDE